VRIELVVVAELGTEGVTARAASRAASRASRALRISSARAALAEATGPRAAVVPTVLLAVLLAVAAVVGLVIPTRERTVAVEVDEVDWVSGGRLGVVAERGRGLATGEPGPVDEDEAVLGRGG
jgi:hypothetical protein